MYRRGAVWTVRIPDVGVKPAVVVSDQTVTHALRPIVARITSVDRDRAIPTVVPLSAGEVDGLPERSFILCHDLMTIPDGGLVDRLGTISRERIVEVEERLMFVFGMEPL